MTIFFYTKTDAYGEFSNFSKHGIEEDGEWWPTVEHYFQAQKFEDKSYQEKIRTAYSSKQAAELGRSRKVPIRADWELVKDEIMFRAVLKKFKTHDKLKELLLSTGVQEIVENAPGDYYWGIGKNGTGLNKLGKILVSVREQLKI
ncbi:NADAR family protein [Rheinheimera baltica]|uniref:NADAR family protein n=1 Tax=Rheinheimera baltica TaxID=67576 RepID=A0ABT9I5E1_9GAMM|nr:NADAR family protein [Rheinheimera baltica]MDP5138602.1 NADAR family protein [Rheinheimera baltica]MDP5151543.1 NADAR family protein [Rheinheimera baltica]